MDKYRLLRMALLDPKLSLPMGGGATRYFQEAHEQGIRKIRFPCLLIPQLDQNVCFILAGEILEFKVKTFFSKSWSTVPVKIYTLLHPPPRSSKRDTLRLPLHVICSAILEERSEWGGAETTQGHFYIFVSNFWPIFLGTIYPNGSSLR